MNPTSPRPYRIDGWEYGGYKYGREQDLKIDQEIYQDALTIYIKVFMHTPVTWIHYDQLIRASSSIAANIAEGIGRKRDDAPTTKLGYYQNFLLIARGSVFETFAWLDIGLYDKTFEKDTVTDIQDLLGRLNTQLETELKPKEPK